MTIIDETAPDTRAKRRNDAAFRLDGGPLPLGKPNALHMTGKSHESQNDTGDRDYSRAHPCKLRLPFPKVLQRLRGILVCATACHEPCHAVPRSRNPGFPTFLRGTSWHVIQPWPTLALAQLKVSSYGEMLFEASTSPPARELEVEILSSSDGPATPRPL